VKWELNRGRKYTLSYHLYRPDGTLLYHKTEQKLKISLHDCDISGFEWRTYGYGWREPGHWPTGVYQADVLIDGARAATGHFTIAPPPPPPPPPPPSELLQQPWVRFYASRGEADSVRFPQQITYEVICTLTVRNTLYGKQDRYYAVTTRCYAIEGRLMFEDKSTWRITSREQEPSISISRNPSGWAQGIYRVEILIDGKDFAWGAFAIE
jgi:hypothetical protein